MTGLTKCLMHLGFMCAVLVLAPLLLAPLTCQAASKLPSVYDGSRDSAVYTGHQNMPYRLYGVAIKWDQACRGGNANECLHLAEAFENGLGDLEPDIRVALGYYLLACDKGNGHACARASAIIMSGDANFTDADLAAKTAETGCKKLKSQEACAALAEAMPASSGGDTTQAAGLADTACASGADDGCRVKARALFYDHTDPASRAAAIPLFQAACNAKRAWGCAGLVDAYENGWGVTQDRARAMEAARIGCEQSSGNRAAVCAQHGKYLTYSTDKASINKGEQFLDTACQVGNSDACVYLGMLGLRDKAGATTTMGEGLYYERRACDLNNGAGCAELALSYQTGNGINPDAGVAIALFDKGCRLGNQDSCQQATGMIANDRNVRSYIPAINPSLTVTEQLLRAQDAVKGSNATVGVQTVIRLMYEENEYAEWLLGGWLYYGLPGVFDTSRQADGVILIENAAKVGHVEADIWIGMAYWYGDSVDEDREKGEHYMLIAAQRGSQEAAAIYRSMKAEPARQEMAARQKAMEEAAIDRRSDWEKAWDAWNAGVRAYVTSGGSNYSLPQAYSGRTTSEIMDESNSNQRFNYLSGATSVCPSSNPYCS